MSKIERQKKFVGFEGFGEFEKSGEFRRFGMFVGFEGFGGLRVFLRFSIPKFENVINRKKTKEVCRV